MIHKNKVEGESRRVSQIQSGKLSEGFRVYLARVFHALEATVFFRNRSSSINLSLTK